MCVCVYRRGVGVGGRWGLKKQRGLLLGLSPVPCLLAVNLISEEKYTLCLYNAGLCLWSASEPSTILEIVSSLLKHFQTVTVEPVSFPVNCLASFLILGLSWASSESKGFLIEITMQRLMLSSLCMEEDWQSSFDLRLTGTHVLYCSNFLNFLSHLHPLAPMSLMDCEDHK